jgi:kynurenine formamidase
MNKFRLIDLTYQLKDTMLVYPYNDRPVYSWRARVNSEGYNLTSMEMIVHTGTHVDSPLHFIADGLPIDKMPLQCFYGITKLFVYNSLPSGQEIAVSDIMRNPDEVEEGSIFLLKTGIESFAEMDDYNRLYPYPSKELVELLIKKRIRCYMTDATSVDPVSTSFSPNHHAILGAGIPIVENLCNLSNLPIGKPITISAVPLPLYEREGSPCRAFAIIED